MFSSLVSNIAKISSSLTIRNAGPRFWASVGVSLLFSLSFLPLSQAFAYSQSSIFVEGDGSSGLAVNPETDRAYVTNIESDTLSVVDTATNELITTIEVGAEPTAVAVNVETGMIYVANYLDSTLSVIDGATNEEVAVIDLGEEADAGPNALVLAGSTLYVSNELSDSISVIDTDDNTISDNIALEEDSGPAGMAYDPSTGLLYVAARNLDTVFVIDPSDQGVPVEASISVDSFPLGVAVNPETNRVYVTNYDSDSVSVIEGESVLTNLTVAFPLGVAVNPETNMIYVSNEDSTIVSVIDGSSNEVVGEIKVGEAPQQLVVVPEDNTLYVASYLSGTLHVVSDLHEQESRAQPFSVSATHEGQTFRITGESEGAKVTSFSIQPFKSVTLNVEGEGEIMISVPSDLVNGIQSLKAAGTGQEIEFYELRSTRNSTDISFDIPAGTTSIEMTGTRVVPEFSVIMLALVVSIMAIIAAQRMYAKGTIHF
jgi:YVTN family beta-propeller protein